MKKKKKKTVAWTLVPGSPVNCRKKQLKKILREMTIFSWNAVLGNISFTKIAENSNIYFFIKSAPHLGD